MAEKYSKGIEKYLIKGWWKKDGWC